MKNKKLIVILTALLLFSFVVVARSQTKFWTVNDCIDYALSKNTDVRKSYLSTQSNELSLEQSKANLLPSLTGSVGNNLNWSKSFDQETGQYGGLSGSNSTSYGLSTGITLFNGFKMKTSIEQAKLNLEGGKYYSETVKESMELSILNAYLQILYAQESVNNAQEQIKSTTEQLAFAEERLNVGVISNADYLQIKSELASEKLTLARAKSTLSIAKVNLMQLMELPMGEQFEVANPDLGPLLELKDQVNAEEIYTQALGFKPEIKQAALTLESVKLDEKIAWANLLPQLSLNAGLSTGWSNQVKGFNYSEQLKNTITPSVGLTLSVPIFQNKLGEINMKQAQLAADDAELDEINTKNELRKKIEQACVDIETAASQYRASVELYESAKESYQVASEKYGLGLLNSVDFLSVKTDLITSESELAQSKYNFIFSSKILDFYKGISISL
ncbi:MAG: TolC family protein [Mangrovibacterium sp.]|nr:TolC family protein [Mangrovibacterium sp.]